MKHDKVQPIKLKFNSSVSVGKIFEKTSAMNAKRKPETPAASSSVVKFYQFKQLMAANMPEADFLDVEVCRGLSVPVDDSSSELLHTETEIFGEVQKKCTDFSK